MRLELVFPYRSIQGPIATSDLPDFVVISGPNGAGKTNLLLAILNGAVQVDMHGGPGLPPDADRVRLLQARDLTAASPGPRPPSPFDSDAAQLYHTVQTLIAQLSNNPQVTDIDLREKLLREDLEQQRQLTRTAINRMVETAGKGLLEFSQEDFAALAPATPGIRDPFTLAIADIFLTYYARRERQRYALWHAERYPSAPGARSAMTDEQFVQRFGPEPWVLLDDVLRAVGFDYRFNAPGPGPYDVSYEPSATHPDGTTVSIEALSSGEQTLLAFALSAFSSRNLGDMAHVPELLLFDEPDASLHPAMARQMLRVAYEILHLEHKRKIIITTHSPTTIALAPPESIYLMHRGGSPLLQPAIPDDALKALTVGIPALSVNTDLRRQVFTESEFDQDCYQEFHRLLRPRLDSPISLEFIASGKGESGGCEAVLHLVQELRGRGNSYISGIVDRDDRAGAPEGVAFVAKRRSLENLALDPLGIVTLLLREQFVQPSDIGLSDDLRHFELGKAHAATMVDFVASKIAQDDDDTTLVDVSYVGGFVLSVPRFYLETSGHQLEERIVTAFPPLKRFRKNLKLQVIRTALGDVPAFIPADVVELFERLQAM